jgi:hypothetical protein
MKTILKIIAILLAMAVVAGAFSLVVNNMSSAAGPIEGGQPLVMNGNNQPDVPRTASPGGGDRDSASPAGGLSGVLVTLGKLTGITIVVLLVQKVSNLVGNRKLSPANDKVSNASLQ